MDTVGYFKFAMNHPVEKIFKILFITFFIRFLDAPATWCIVTGNTKADGGTIAEWNLFLNEAFSV
jgi:hypothetical protein